MSEIEVVQFITFSMNISGLFYGWLAFFSPSELLKRLSKSTDLLALQKLAFQKATVLNMVNRLNITCSLFYMIKTKVAFLRAGFYPANQSNLKFSKSSDWLEKSRLSKKTTFVLIM